MASPRRLAAILALTGMLLGAVAAASLFRNSAEGADGALPHRAVVPALAADSPGSSPVSSFQIVVIDVGQGDATLITVNGQRLLIDGGRSGTTIKARLQTLGITDLDAIVATHPDADHIGGLAQVLGMFKVERIYLNGDTSDTATWDTFIAAVNVEGASVVTLRRGQNVPLGGLQIPVLHPPSLSGDSNVDSIVLQLTCGSVDVLFTGDAETASETSMLTAGVVRDVNVLKVGHHGSNSSSSLAFLQALDPEVAVISAGLNNQYGHPHAETLASLSAVGASLRYTDTTAGDDSVIMTSDCATYSFSVVPGGGATLTHTPTSTPTTPGAATPTTTNTPIPTATPTTGGGYSLPACYSAGQNTCNCSNFTTQAHAQWFHNTYDPTDVNALDADDDGVVCESLP
ncbi:MAG: MBL fold metallo-hydrolase [Chloroflexi bacterium]|nr:MBL fold metallo-hydrolase [Chloroflexota bacterium]